MAEPALSIPATGCTAQVDIHVNLSYSLSHYLVRQGMESPAEQDPATAPAAERAALARHPRGVHDIWDEWEVPVASATTLGDAISGLRSRMNQTVDTLASAMGEVEVEFRERLWPERQPAIAAALGTLREVVAPRFAEMARRQAAMLDLIWPNRIDAYLVTDCYDWRGAYSHPLTIDVTANVGLTLCETFLHEATHVADVYTMQRGHRSLSSRLSDGLGEMGISRPAVWNVWHAIIFAASAQQVRTFIEPAHADYATEHGLYEDFGVPDLPGLWTAFTEGSLDEVAFLGEVAQRTRGRVT